jgi:hypothetical protein
MQHDAGTASQLYAGQQKPLTTAYVGFLAFKTTAEQQFVVTYPDNGEIFNGVIMKQIDFGQRKVVAAAVRIMELQGTVDKVESCCE